MSFDLIWIGLIQGLILFFFTFGLFLSFRVMQFPDLTGEGSFPFGAALTSWCLLHHMSPFFFLPLVFGLGGCLGLLTVLLRFKLNIHSLLAGVIVNTMIYSVNLRIMGAPNVAFFNEKVLMVFQTQSFFFKIIFLIFCSFIILLGFFCFFQTEKGLAWRTIGLNSSFAKKNGLSVHLSTGLALFWSSGLSALAGCFLAQIQGYSDLNMGIGLLIHGLASLMIGESLFSPSSKFFLFAPFVGALLYQQVQGVVLSLGVSPTDLKFITGAFLLIILFFHQTLFKKMKIESW
jgi:putative ABC transport system permease protein